MSFISGRLTSEDAWPTVAIQPAEAPPGGQAVVIKSSSTTAVKGNPAAHPKMQKGGKIKKPKSLKTQKNEPQQ